MKKTISESIHHYLVKHANNEEKMEEFSNFIEDFFCNMEEDYAEVKAGFYSELEDFTDELDEEMIHDMVEKFKRKDGTVSGVKWSLEEIENVAKQYDIKSKLEGTGKPCDMLKFWVSMNYVYAVHYSINRTINGYIDLAVDEYANKNICFDALLKKIFEKI
jgi:wyosine [tRNA(Phe)-imidazoG37] synthetase (radical SAM superfamily)